MDNKVLYLILANVILFLAVRFSKKRRWINNVFLLLFTTLFLLTVIEVAYRLFFRKSNMEEIGNYGGSLNTLHPTYGFIMKPIEKVEHMKRDHQAGDTLYNVIYTLMADTGVNRQQFHHRVGYNGAIDSVEMIFMGCSFTFGSGINDNETLPYQSGKMANLNSINMASGGWGTHQVYQLYKHKYQNAPGDRKRIFVYSFIPDHLMRAKCVYSWNINDPYFAVEGDSLRWLGPAYQHSDFAKFQVAVRVLSAGRTFTFISDMAGNIGDKNAAKGVIEEDYRRIELMLNEMASEIRKRGDQFVIVHWDDYKGAVSEDRVNKIMHALQGQDVAILDVSNTLSMDEGDNFIRRDHHPTGTANFKIASTLLRTLQREKTSNSASVPQKP